MCITGARRTLPAIPLTTTRTTTTSRQQQRRRQRRRETALQTFDDDGHYSDIHWNVGGAARIPTWRRSFIDDTGHYHYLEFNQLTGENTREQRHRSSSDYQGLDQADRRPPVPHHYTGIGSGQPRSRTNAAGYVEPVEQSENENRRILGQFHQPARELDHSSVRSQSDTAVYTSEQRRRQELPERSRSYGDVEDKNSLTDRCHDLDESYEGLDPAAVEELRRRANRPHEYAGLTNGNSGKTHGEIVESRDYEGLDPVEVEEARQRARQPRVYATLTDNVEDLYSRPTKKR